MQKVTYLFTARHPSGDEITDRVAAVSAAEAIALLQRRGFTEVRLHEDDAFVTDMRRPMHPTHKHVAPKILAKLQTADTKTALLLQILNAYRQWGPWLLVIACFFAYRRATGKYWTVIDFVFIPFLLAPLAMAVFFSGSGRTYRRVQELSSQGRWAEIEALLPKLERVLTKLGPKGQLEFAVWRAKVAVEKGHTVEAVAIIDHLKGAPGISEVDFLTARSRILSSIPDYPSALQCYHRMAELAPESPIGWMSIAECCAVHLLKPDEARAALDRARSFGLSEMNKSVFQLIEGAIALDEDQPAVAREKLSSGLPFIERRAQGLPIAIGYVRMYETLLAEACAKLGDHAAAREYLSHGREQLIRNRLGHLVQRAEAALSNTAS